MLILIFYYILFHAVILQHICVLPAKVESSKLQFDNMPVFQYFDSSNGFLCLLA